MLKADHGFGIQVIWATQETFIPQVAGLTYGEGERVVLIEQRESGVLLSFCHNEGGYKLSLAKRRLGTEFYRVLVSRKRADLWLRVALDYLNGDDRVVHHAQKKLGR